MVPRAVPSMMFPVHSQLTTLREIGFNFDFDDTPVILETVVRAYHLLCSSDEPARAKHNSVVSCTGTNGCSGCDALFQSRIVGKKRDGSVQKKLNFYIPYSAFLESCELQTKTSMLRDGEAWIRAPNKSQARKTLSLRGCRLSLFSENPFYDVSCAGPFELSHGLIRGMHSLHLHVGIMM